MTYRNDYDALLARNTALEVENRRLRRDRVVRPLKPVAPPRFTLANPRTHPDLEGARIELGFLLEDRAHRQRLAVVLGASLGAIALCIVPALFGASSAFWIIFGLLFALVAISAVTQVLPITGERSLAHFDRITYLRAYLAANDRPS